MSGGQPDNLGRGYAQGSVKRKQTKMAEPPNPHEDAASHVGS